VRSAPIVVDGIARLADHVRPRDPAEAKRLYEEALAYARQRPHDNGKNIEYIQKRLQDLPGTP
jgi:hypothetical protein